MHPTAEHTNTVSSVATDILNLYRLHCVECTGSVSEWGVSVSVSVSEWGVSVSVSV